MSEALVQELIDVLGGLSWEERLEKLKDYADHHIAFSSSYSFEDQAIFHVIASGDLPVRVFTLDTGRHFSQTYDVMQKTREAYPGKEIEIMYPDAQATQELVQKQGVNGFYDSVEARKACCFVRKVQPLDRALNGVGIWITGLRREHSDNRSDMAVAEWDAGRGIVKVNPLIDIPEKTIRPFIKEHNIPYNVLHDEGYPSIGCAPCTRAVQAGEHPRAGRWWWEQDDKQECGLHLVDGKLVRAMNI